MDVITWNSEEYLSFFLSICKVFLVFSSPTATHLNNSVMFVSDHRHPFPKTIQKFILREAKLLVLSINRIVLPWGKCSDKPTNPSDSALRLVFCLHFIKFKGLPTNLLSKLSVSWFPGFSVPLRNVD